MFGMIDISAENTIIRYATHYISLLVHVVYYAWPALYLSLYVSINWLYLFCVALGRLK